MWGLVMEDEIRLFTVDVGNSGSDGKRTEAYIFFQK